MSKSLKGGYLGHCTRNIIGVIMEDARSLERSLLEIFNILGYIPLNKA